MISLVFIVICAGNYESDPSEKFKRKDLIAILLSISLHHDHMGLFFRKLQRIEPIVITYLTSEIFNISDRNVQDLDRSHNYRHTSLT